MQVRKQQLELDIRLATLELEQKNWFQIGNRVRQGCILSPCLFNLYAEYIMASGPITSWEIDGETVEMVSDFIFLAPKSLQMVTAAMKLKDTYSLEGKL